MSGIPRPTVDSCTKACKTRIAAEDTSTTVVANRSDYTTTATYNYLYHQCGQSGCPLGAGEEVVRDCQCIDEFPNATAIMQALRMAGRDIVCSNGQKETIK